jgi:hypothetical protein
MVGQLLAHYTILEKIGAGGMASYIAPMMSNSAAM